jgi:shikimate kinase
VMSRNVCFVGMPGAGKSRVAQLVGRRLGRRVADTDTELERWTGSTVPELFEEHGEAGFRRLEHDVVAELATFHDLVVSLGGGAVLDDDNVAALLLTGVLVHLDAPVEVLARRIEGGPERPLLAGDLHGRLRATHAARDARYREVADVTLDATRSPRGVADAVIQWAAAQGDVLTPSEHEQVMT